MSEIHDLIHDVTISQKFRIEVGQTLRVYENTDDCSRIYICTLHARAGADMSRRMPVWCYIKRKVHEGKTNKSCNDLIEFDAARHTKNTAMLCKLTQPMV